MLILLNANPRLGASTLQINGEYMGNQRSVIENYKRGNSVKRSPALYLRNRSRRLKNR